MTKRAFGNLELQILQLFTQGKKRLTIKEVQQLLGGSDKYTTIMTVMNRLVEKKQLSRERIGLQYQYWLCQMPSFFQQIKKRLFGLKTSEVVSCLIQSGDLLSDEELQEMEALIRKTREERQKL